MLITETNSNKSGRRFIIRPNRSLSGNGMLLFVAGVSALTLGVAARFWILGAWAVMPFAFLEVMVLVVSMYMFERGTRVAEIIEINDGILWVTRVDSNNRRQWDFHPYWVQIILRPDPKDWYPSRLYLRSHGRLLEIGGCLTDEERVHLSDTLKHELLINTGKPV